MARDLNQVIVIGRLVKNPEIKYTTNGTPVTKFSIANNFSFTQNNEKKDYTSYFDINVWGNQAVVCEKYLKKGSQVAIVGSLRQNRWNDKATGQTRSKVEITASSIQFLTPQSGTSGASTQSAMNNEQPNFIDTEPGNDAGIIQDPWKDEAGKGSNINDPFMGEANGNSDDDIPF
jgi:single-strand DNA-binding protein